MSNIDKLDSEPRIVVLTVKSWKITTKYPCPVCSKKLSAPKYTCEDELLTQQPQMSNINDNEDWWEEDEEDCTDMPPRLLCLLWML